MAGRVMVIGWDGATWDLLDKLMAEGAMPNLSALVARSARSRMDSVVPPVTGPAWVSMATGVNPGRHSCYDFNKPNPQTGELVPIQSFDIAEKTFYEVLEERGRKTILVNLPVSFPPLTSQITLTSLMTVGDNAVFPESLKDKHPELKGYRVFPDINLRFQSRIAEYIKDIRAVEAARMACVRVLLHEPWDCFFVVFSGSDWVSHELFPALMEGGEGRQQAVEAFSELDEYLGEILSHLDDQDHVLLVSDHGFCSVRGALFINELLARWRELAINYSPGKNIASVQAEKRLQEQAWQGSFPPWKARIADVLWKTWGLTFLFRALRKLIPIDWPHQFGVDAKGSRFYMPTTASRGLRGVGVTPGQVEALRSKLAGLKDPEGKPVLDYIVPREEVYTGPYVQEAPELLFGSYRWELESAIRSFKRKVFVDKSMGAHHKEGVLLLSGPAVEVGAGGGPKPNLLQVAPLIYYLLGEPIPQGLDGALPDRFLKTSWREAKPPRYIPVTAPERQRRDFEASDIQDRLRTLGYME